MPEFLTGRRDIKLIIKNIELEVADSASAELELKKARAIAVRAGETIIDIASLSSLSSMPDKLVAITFDDKEGREIHRHSTAHVMAHAIKELYPAAKLAIGPSIEDGFYYDIDIDRPFVPEDLTAIEKKMAEIIKRNSKFNRSELPRMQAIEMFRSAGEIYKVELLNELKDENVSIYEEGGFTDLCRGPHLTTTGRIAAVKLLSIAGAYWRGDEKNKMLQRIYGISFDDKDSLKKHMEFLEEVKKRDHRRLGKELDLFSMSDDIGPGLTLWHPKGAMMRKVIEDHWKDAHIKNGYQLLYTPHIARLNLWKKSGHLDFYSENMYSPMEVEGMPYELKPMNCPFHIAIYKSNLRSYREFPIRYAELGTVYRYERSGVLHGLLRVRGFTQDDAHIFIREDQLETEIQNVLDLTVETLLTFGFESYDIYLSTRPEKYVGSDEHWATATSALEQALKTKALPYTLDPGEGVFYGPKIDIKVKDTLGRSWQCSTIQVDFNLPERFDITYRGSDGKDHRPTMVHRALMGSLERFFGVLIEHYAGAFPLWLAPVQTVILTIVDRHAEAAQELAKTMRDAGIRVDVDDSNEKIGYKIREYTMKKVPYLVIIGDNEVQQKSFTVRKRSGENIGPYTADELVELFSDQIRSRR